MPADLTALGAILALASAAAWGSGDFSGGLASRRASQFQVLALSALSGLALLAVFALLRSEALPSRADAAWAAAAGLGGALGIACLYRGLSLGNAVSVAPTAAVISAAVPVVFGLLAAGWPGSGQMAGFLAAGGGLWLVSRPANDQPARTAVSAAAAPDPRPRLSQSPAVLAAAAGIGFGSFFVLIAQVQPGLVFTPLLVARGVALLTALLLLRARGLPLPGLRGNPVALLAGVLDAAGNALYVLANQFTRLDIAAVLASLYPAATVLLAAALLKERVSGGQWAGLALCIAAVALIAG
jgi:drug/metabolite transporter (DMT)-like permease